MQSGTILRNRYRILQELGSGGFGDTYLAEDRDLPGNPPCVVKHFQPKNNDPRAIPVAQRLFETEAKTLYKLGRLSDRIPTLFAHFEEGGQFYLVQEYVEGQDLSEEIVQGKPLSESYVRELLAELLEVLEVAHQQKVVHRDIKPQNLMRRKGDGKVVLIDFGAVKEIGTLIVTPQGQTEPSVVVGTSGYMPSEQAKGRPKLSSDIYAVGMVGIQALTGLLPEQLPEEPDTGKVIWRNQISVSEELGGILEKMVSDHFSERFVDAVEARSALVPDAKVSRSPRVGALVSGVSSAWQHPQRRQFLRWLVFGGTGFAGAVLIRSWWNGGSRRVEAEPKVSSPSSPPSPQLFGTVKVNPEGTIIERFQVEAKVLTENLGNGIDLEMVYVPGGRFLMGSPENEDKKGWRYNGEAEEPQHDVSVPAFFMGKYPVTQEQYQAVMGKEPSRFKGDNRPVENVTWNDATEFCQKLSQQTGKTYRLPSEAEWEYACRARTTTPFYFGPTITTELANYKGNRTYGSGPKGVDRGETRDVESRYSNAFGLYDMHGNVFEWCQDVWHENYNGAPTDGSAWESGGDSSRRLRRGGSWDDDPRVCRSAYRNSNDAGKRDSGWGFRVVLVPGA